MATTAKIVIQPLLVPLATFEGPGGKQVLVFITREWQRTFNQMAKQINDLQDTVAALDARVAALE